MQIKRVFYEELVAFLASCDLTIVVRRNQRQSAFDGDGVRTGCESSYYYYCITYLLVNVDFIDYNYLYTITVFSPSMQG